VRQPWGFGRERFLRCLTPASLPVAATLPEAGDDQSERSSTASPLWSPTELQRLLKQLQVLRVPWKVKSSQEAGCCGSVDLTVGVVCTVEEALEYAQMELPVPYEPFIELSF
jgi:hypothetical protein